LPYGEAMADTYLSAMPCRLTAGDSLALRLSPNQSAADGWTAAITMMLPGWPSLVTWPAATADGSDFLFDVPADTTSAWPAGAYTWQARVSKAGEVHTVDGGVLEIRAALAAGLDNRTHEEKCLIAIKAYLAGDLSAPMAEYRVGDSTGYRMVKSHTLKELLQIQAYYQRMVDRQQGKSGGGLRTIPVRFVGV